MNKDQQQQLGSCAHGADERTCFTCAAEGPSVLLPSEWKREGMVVVADSMTGKLLGCMGRETWLAMHPNTPGLEHGFKRACECGRATDDRCDYCAAYIPREGTLGVRGHLVNLLDALDSDEDDPIYADQLATAEEQARNALREGRFVTCGRCKADKIPVVGLGDHADNCPDCGSLIGRARQDGLGSTGRND